MSSVLRDICTRRLSDVAEAERAVPLPVLSARAAQAEPPRGFAQALSQRVEAGQPALIAELKKASPSRGLIRDFFDPPALARAYTEAGAACLSVLTEPHAFQGQDEDLRRARAATSLPVLRKDFTLTPYQVIEARSLGADAILLILAALSDAQARELEACAQSLGMDVLAEVHDAGELERALTHLRTRLIGINNRDLHSLQVSLETSERLAARLPAGYIGVCESGIQTHADIARMREVGLHCFLVGESLMRAADVAAATRQLLTGR